MKLLFILALVAVGLVLLSLIRVGVWVTYGPEGPTLRIKVGPVKLSLFPPKEKSAKRNRKSRSSCRRRENCCRWCGGRCPLWQRRRAG